MVAGAKGAGVRHLPQDDVSPFDVDEEVVAFPDIEHSAGLGRYDDPPQVVDLAGNPRFHGAQPTDRSAGDGGYRRDR